jgi:membrane-associated protein
VAGDQIGFLAGRRYGQRLIDRLPPRVRRSGEADRALDLVRRRGAVAVTFGRWAAVLRALVPGMAGVSGMGRARFTAANAVGGTLWAAAVSVAGFVAGASYRALERRLSWAGDVLLGLLLVVGAVLVIRSLIRSRRAG